MKAHEDIYVAYIPTLAVLPYNTVIYYPKIKSIYFHHCWETWHHLTSSQLPSGCLQDRCSNDVDTSCASETRYDKRMEYLNFFTPWSAISECRPDHTPKKSTAFISTKQFHWVSTERLLITVVPLGDGIFYLQPIVHLLHFFTDLGIGCPLNVGGSWL